MPGFFQQLANRRRAFKTPLCIGLDPRVDLLPASVQGDVDPIFTFNRAIIDATRDMVCCYKPQIAYYAAAGAEASLKRTIDYIHAQDIPVILDAKRGDIGSTAQQYAVELYDRFEADAVTINPYLGSDSLQPFIERGERGVFILCRTSNPGGSDLQNQLLENGRTVYEEVAHLAATEWNGNQNIGLVVGATRLEEISQVRKIVGGMELLLPGVGAQGADIQQVVDCAGTGGMIINSSRAIIYASSGQDFAEGARCAAESTLQEIRQYASNFL